ncbi:MAG: glycosyltransferase family 2 protein [Planctomycetes bacterium]|nr:glycosyltransferase family 2 protein [Planctomycetota bacterium]
MRASVILPTKDRGPAIDATIEALLAQDLDDYEVVIVDNCSSPENAAGLRAWAARHPTKVRYVHEPALGLDNARNAGIRAARAAVLAFLDDDAVAPSHWLRTLVQAFDDHPRAWAVGGGIVSRFTTPAPDWVDARLQVFLSDFRRGDRIETLHFDDYPRGANMAFRREAFATCGPFLDCLDRKGALLLSYGDIEMCHRVERSGHDVLWVPGADVDHLIRGDRLTPEWFARRCYWQGRSEGLFERIHRGRLHQLRKLPYRLLRCVVSADRYKRMHHRGLVSATLRTLLRTRFT